MMDSVAIMSSQDEMRSFDKRNLTVKNDYEMIRFAEDGLSLDVRVDAAQEKRQESNVPRRGGVLRPHP